MKHDDIPGYDPSRLDHRRALAALEDFQRFAPHAHSTVAGIKASWEGWTRWVCDVIPPLLGVDLSQPPMNRAERRRRKRH